MSDDIGYRTNEEDIQAVIRWLEENDPENANPEFAKQFLVDTKDMFRDIGHIDEDLLHKELEKYKKKNS